MSLLERFLNSLLNFVETKNCFLNKASKVSEMPHTIGFQTLAVLHWGFFAASIDNGDPKNTKYSFSGLFF